MQTISELIRDLTEIQKKYGDITVVDDNLREKDYAFDVEFEDGVPLAALREI